MITQEAIYVDITLRPLNQLYIVKDFTDSNTIKKPSATSKIGFFIDREKILIKL